MPVAPAASLEEIRRKVGPMDPAHRMDWAILDLGYKPVSKRTINISDLDVHVWGLDLIEGSTLPIAMIVSGFWEGANPDPFARVGQ